MTLAALEAGAVDAITKPSVDVARGLTAMLNDLREKVKIAVATNVSARRVNRQLRPRR